MAIDSVSTYSPVIAPVTQSLASGSRINSAVDSPAEQAIVTSLTSQINQQDISTQNANSGIGLLQTADGVSESIGEQLQRLSELSLQSQNGTLSNSQREGLNQEFQQGLEAINQFVGQANFNGNNLLDGSKNEINIALGGNSDSLSLPNFSTDGLSLDGLNISSAANAENALGNLSEALKTFSNGRSTLGAQQNGLAASVSNLSSQSANTQASRSQINDTDFAAAIAEQTRLQILEQSSVAMQAQRNQDKSSVMQLLS